MQLCNRQDNINFFKYIYCFRCDKITLNYNKHIHFIRAMDI